MACGKTSLEGQMNNKCPDGGHPPASLARYKKGLCPHPGRNPDGSRRRTRPRKMKEKKERPCPRFPPGFEPKRGIEVTSLPKLEASPSKKQEVKSTSANRKNGDRSLRISIKVPSRAATVKKRKTRDVAARGQEREPSFNLQLLPRELVGEIMERLGRQGRRVFRTLSKGIMRAYFGGYHRMIIDLLKKRVDYKK